MIYSATSMKGDEREGVSWKTWQCQNVKNVIQDNSYHYQITVGRELRYITKHGFA